MAHFAKLDANGIVEQVIVVSNDDVKDNSGTETESIGVSFCQKLFGADTNWKQTSYNANIRGNYAGIGYTYMTNVATLGVASTDVFIEQQPYASWSIGITTSRWFAPANPGEAPELTTAERTAGKYYVWNGSNYQSDPATAWVLTSP